MTYGEVFITWLHRALVVLLIICIVGMAIVSIEKAKRVTAEADAYIRYLDDRYGWDDLRR